MLAVGRALLEQAAPGAATQFGFHLPPFNSVDHLHLHCFALPFTPAWKAWKYSSPGGAHLWYLPVEALLRVRCLRCVLRSLAWRARRTHAPAATAEAARAARRRGRLIRRAGRRGVMRGVCWPRVLIANALRATAALHSCFRCR